MLYFLYEVLGIFCKRHKLCWFVWMNVSFWSRLRDGWISLILLLQSLSLSCEGGITINFNFPPECVRKICQSNHKKYKMRIKYRQLQVNEIVNPNRCKRNRNNFWRANNEQTIVLLRVQQSATTEFHTVREKHSLNSSILPVYGELPDCAHWKIQKCNKPLTMPSNMLRNNKSEKIYCCERVETADVNLQ